MTCDVTPSSAGTSRKCRYNSCSWILASFLLLLFQIKSEKLLWNIWKITAGVFQQAFYQKQGILNKLDYLFIFDRATILVDQENEAAVLAYLSNLLPLICLRSETGRFNRMFDKCFICKIYAGT